MDDLGKIVKVAGPLVVAENMAGSKMFDVVYVSDKKLMGEIIEFNKDLASIQVYEETGGIGVGEPVYPTGGPLTVELGPGLLQSIYDGIQRPLDEIYKNTGNFIARGVSAAALNRERKWEFEPMVKMGDMVSGGDFLGFVNETEIVRHYIMVPPGIAGEVRSIEKGEFTVEDTIAILKDSRGDRKITMMQKWPVREPRPYLNKISPDMPLFTGQRVIDMFFPIARGGTACIPGPFGSGKTVVQHQLAKWINAEIIVYIGCGERGNEMTEVLMEFPELTDPRSGAPLMKRTVLIANTSNMPVAAREASVYTGITIAEYFRDMGYSVALMADSTSRWAEAMREISGRLEEMPGEEGYPAYLGARLASFYERAGMIKCLSSGKERQGALSVIGAVSPPGGDLSDPVVQATLRVVKVFWSLEDRLAYARHFPAISWLSSYSLYIENIRDYITKNLKEDYFDLQAEAMRILEKESELEEIVRLVGIDALSGSDRLILLTARMLREDFLHQIAFHEVDTYSPIEKQYKMIDTIIYFYNQANNYLKINVDIKAIENMEIRNKIARMKYIKNEEINIIDKIKKDIDKEFSSMTEE
ncbi:MAG: V-type ATP synthase subunit A [Actinobacteria bacterium RBG_13_35_12]|nr:MAG: V-type ATP synthase subunit A [Actinobacteria bacterium RBG_13_35_12]